MIETGFPCSADSTASVLILGSMPSQKSLAAKQYYAHPQNAFWPIMAELLGFDARLVYEDRLARLRDNHVALWDVAHQCIRPGSMDSAIKIESVIANNFTAFLKTYPNIRTIYFNGRKAEQLFLKLVWPALPETFRHIERHLLPSTSPAHAMLSRAQKRAVWKIVVQTLESD